MVSVISSAASVAQAKSSSSAWTTLARASAYSTVEGTSTTRPMLAPQWQTKTPTRGSSCETSLSGG